MVASRAGHRLEVTADARVSSSLRAKPPTPRTDVRARDRPATANGAPSRNAPPARLHDACEVVAHPERPQSLVARELQRIAA